MPTCHILLSFTATATATARAFQFHLRQKVIPLAAAGGNQLAISTQLSLLPLTGARECVAAPPARALLTSSSRSQVPDATSQQHLDRALHEQREAVVEEADGGEAGVEEAVSAAEGRCRDSG